MTQEHKICTSWKYQTTAAQTKEDEDKHTGIRKEKIWKVGSEAQNQENRTQGVHSNKVSRLCYKTDPGTLSHSMPSSSCSRHEAMVSSVTINVKYCASERLYEYTQHCCNYSPIIRRHTHRGHIFKSQKLYVFVRHVRVVWIDWAARRGGRVIVGAVVCLQVGG